MLFRVSFFKPFPPPVPMVLQFPCLQFPVAARSGSGPKSVPLGQGHLGTIPSTSQRHGSSCGPAVFCPGCIALHHCRRWDAIFGGEANFSSCRHHPAIILNNKQTQTNPKQDKKQRLIIWQDLWSLMYSIKCGNKNIQLLILSFRR